MYKSKDLREAAVRYRIEGHTLVETAKVFGVGKHQWADGKNST